MVMAKAFDWAGLRHRLLAEMRAREWSQRDLAEALKVKQPSVSKFLNGGGPSPELLWHASRLLETQMEALIPDALKKETGASGHATLRPSGLQREASRRLLQLANDILVAVEREAADALGETHQTRHDPSNSHKRR